jgi:hypothetical protein
VFRRRREHPTCECHTLEKLAADPDVPLVRHPERGTWEFVFPHPRGGDGRINLSCCPFCGGEAPRVPYESLYHDIDADQAREIELRADSLCSAEDVIAEFGAPDSQFPAGWMWLTPERDGTPPTAEFSDTLTYQNLSPVMEVTFRINGTGQVAVSYTGKRREEARV